MKVLFLDIDGVLNSDSFHRTLEAGTSFIYGLELEPRALKLFEEFLLSAPELKIVISSSWRDTLTLEQFQEVLSPYVDAQRIIGLTSSEVDKAPSIEAWIKEHNPSEVLILDDDTLFDLSHRLHKRQVKTSLGLGLRDDHIKALKELLKGSI